MKKLKFPETLYVKYDDAGDGDEYLLPADSPLELAESDPVDIGVYEFVETRRIRLAVEELS